jgi:cytidylate kinase
MYRAVALEVLRRGLDAARGEDCARVAASLKLEFDAQGRIQIDGRPGEPDIRGREVTALVSAVSAHPAVREPIVARQRHFAHAWGGLVAEGRDMTSVVFPHAEHKFFLTASSSERARRRARELGTPADVAAIQAEIERRDGRDSSRAASPLVRAADAHVVDTDQKSIDEVVAEVLRAVRGARA